MPHLTRPASFLYSLDLLISIHGKVICVTVPTNGLLVSASFFYNFVIPYHSESTLCHMPFSNQWDINNYDANRDLKSKCTWPFFFSCRTGLFTFACLSCHEKMPGQPVGRMWKTREPGWPGLLQLTLDDQALSCKPASCLPDLWVTPAEMRWAYIADLQNQELRIWL